MTTTLPDPSVRVTRRAMRQRTTAMPLSEAAPDVAAEALDWDPSRVSSGSRALLPWRCTACGNEWTAEVRTRVRGQRGCPACTRLAHPPLSVTHPLLAAQMLPPFDPDDITHGSKLKVRWRGPLGHEWDAAVANRVKGSGCPVCAHGAGARARQQPAAGASLADTHPVLAEEACGWDPAQYRAGSNARQAWRCTACSHEWVATIFHRTHGQGCPVCARAQRRRRSVTPETTQQVKGTQS